METQTGPASGVRIGVIEKEGNRTLSSPQEVPSTPSEPASAAVARHLAARSSWALLAVSLTVGPLAASDLTLSFEVTVQQTSVGSVDDPAGLDGATISVTATVPDGAVWLDAVFMSGDVYVATSSHSFTISGASVAASNGTYSDPTGLLFFYFPGLSNSFVRPPIASFDLPRITLGSGPTLGLGFALSSVAPGDEPTLGGWVDASQFANTFHSSTVLADSTTPSANLYAIDTVVMGPMTMGGPTPVELEAFSVE